MSIRSMEQEGLGDEARLIFITHRARDADVQATLRDLARARGGRPHRLGDARRRRRGVDPVTAVKYVSTRGQAPVLGFGDVLLDGPGRRRRALRARALAGPRPGCRGRRVRPYADVAIDVMWPFVEGSIDRDDVRGDRRRRLRHLRPPRRVPRRAELGDDSTCWSSSRDPRSRSRTSRSSWSAGSSTTSSPRAASGPPSSAPPRATPARPPSRPAWAATRSTS